MASKEKISDLLDSNPYILRVLVNSDSLGDARKNMSIYLNQCEEQILSTECMLHPLEKKNTRDCINVFKNIISECNEQKTQHSCLNTLWKLTTEHWRQADWPSVSEAFLEEMKHLFKGVIGLSGIYSKSGICKREVPAFVNMEGRDAAIVRSNLLNEKAEQYNTYIKRNDYRTGLDSNVIKKREENKKLILDYLQASEKDWDDYNWQMNTCFQDVEEISRIIELSDEEKECIIEATANKIPFGVSPFYLSLMDREQTSFKHDRSLRSHVIPNGAYLDRMLSVGTDKIESLDFMHESDTSPEELITRRYSMVAIIKPYVWCPQICIYCQRNWELMKDGFNHVSSSKAKLGKAISWFKSNTAINEVLITGGDPMSLTNDEIDYLLKEFSQMEHIKRIRIGTRTIVTMPMRFNEELLGILKKYNDLPGKTITLVTHIQHAYEINSYMLETVRKIKLIGIDIYNQQVFTTQNCRKFETCFLREGLRELGIIPYYLFNLKGKDETSDFKVPIARLLQEQKEEARLMPGVVRTDKPVFNLPVLGKNELSSWQDHDIIMVLDDGSRIYEFYPWEKYMAPVNTYLFQDEPIYDFLKRLEALNEDPDDYKTIWYYF